MQLVAVLAGEDFSTDKLPGTRIVGHWQYMPNQQHVMAECTEENALQVNPMPCSPEAPDSLHSSMPYALLVCQLLPRFAVV